MTPSAMTPPAMTPPSMTPPAMTMPLPSSVVRLLERPQWQQRTPEWYAVRQTLITASDASSALGVPPFKTYSGNPREDLLKKKLENQPLNNVFVLHGQHYEDEALGLAMDALGETAIEVGLFRHQRLPWLGASPDGITMTGRCIEIKCPLRRTIQPGVIPSHYMPQVQVQMEVCDLPSTIFIQYQPAHVARDGKMMLDIVVIERDTQWFAKHVDALQSFFDEYTEAKKTFVPIEIQAKVMCRIDDDLYSE